MIDYEEMILARQDWQEIIEDVGDALCCDNCNNCDYQEVCYWYREDQEV